MGSCPCLIHSSNFFDIARRHQKRDSAAASGYSGTSCAPPGKATGIAFQCFLEVLGAVYIRPLEEGPYPFLLLRLRNSRMTNDFFYNLYGLTPSFFTCSVNSRTTWPNLGPSAAETHSRRKRSSSIPKSASINLMASARFSVL